MITMTKREIPTRDFPDMTTDELESEWLVAKGCFDRARAQKIETDRLYLAAATRLNTLDRLVKKAEQRAALDRRAAAKSLLNSISGSTAPSTRSVLVQTA